MNARKQKRDGIVSLIQAAVRSRALAAGLGEEEIQELEEEEEVAAEISDGDGDDESNFPACASHSRTRAHPCEGTRTHTPAARALRYEPPVDEEAGLVGTEDEADEEIEEVVDVNAAASPDKATAKPPPPKLPPKAASPPPKSDPPPPRQDPLAL